VSGWSGTTSAVGITAPSAELDAIEGQLSPGERIEWIGRPDRKKLFSLSRAEEIVFVPAFVFFGVSLCVEILGGLYGTEGSWVVSVFAFCAVTVPTSYLAFGRVVHRALRKRRTVYAVTNRRAMSIRRRISRDDVTAVDLRDLPDLSPDIASDGRGTLQFGLTSRGQFPVMEYGLMASWERQNVGWLAPLPAGLAFYDIDDPQSVARLIKGLLEES